MRRNPVAELSQEVLEELKRHVQHFCSTGWDEESKTLTFGCVQCQVSLFEVSE